MVLTSASSRANVRDAYMDSAAYEENGSLAEAKAFVTACRFLLAPFHTPRRSSKGGDGGGEVEFDLAEVRLQMEAAQRYVQDNPASDESNARHVSFANFRR